MKGIIFDIKEFSVHDGPGGRTTVFMKGCPLRCRWCHNPEGWESRIQLMKKHNLCTHCGSCERGCNHDECQSLGVCVHACPNGCLSISGSMVDSRELAEKLKTETHQGDQLSFFMEQTAENEYCVRLVKTENQTKNQVEVCRCRVCFS